MILKYTGAVLPDGTIKMPKRARAEITEHFRGKEIEFQVKRIQRMKTNPQLGYYFGVVVEYILQGMQDAGNNLPSTKQSRELVHRFLKRRFLEPKRLADANGEIMEFDPSLAEQTKEAASVYIDECIRFAAEFLNVTIPEAGGQSEMRL